MRRTLTRSSFILILALFFLAGVGLFSFRYLTEGKDWTNMPYNGHLSDSGLARAGVVYDRYGDVLAYSTDEDRHYNEDENIRRATLHIVGDNSENISTAVQSIYRSQLTGYNKVFGLALPTSLEKGRDIRLTIDSGACATAYNALGGRNGAVVIFNYETGEILCSVSTPTYDPMNVPEITDDNEEYEGVYLDRTISVTYTPGSIFKIVTTAAALENIDGVESKTFHCEGKKEIGGDDITCMDEHGDISLKEAVAYSCNIAFAELACEIGSEKMTDMAERMGVTESFSIDGNPTAKGHYDVSKADKNQLAWSGIGQYTNEVCPMNMAIMAGMIARGGSAITPYFIENSSGMSILSSLGRKIMNERILERGIAEKIGDMMRYTVSDYYGESLFPTLTVCAKTGTAEVGNDKEPHGWIIGYTLDDDCPLAFASVVEHGGLGYYSAGNVVSAALADVAENLRTSR